MTRCIKPILVFLIAFLVTGATAHASSYRPRIIWLDDLGNVIKVPYDYSIKWKWLDIDGLGFKTPHIEMKITLNEGWKISSFENSSKASQLNDTEMRLYLDGEIGSYVVALEDSTGRSTHLGLAIQLAVTIPDHFIHESCKALGVNIEPLKLRRTHLFSALSCSMSGKNIDLFVVQSTGGKDVSTQAENAERVSENIIKISKDLTNIVIGEKIASFRVTKKGESEASEFDIVKVQPVDVAAAPKKKPEEVKPQKKGPWAFNGGVGFTYLKYKESPLLTGNIDLSEIVLTLKGGASFALSDKWSLGASAYANALPISTSPASTTAAQFFGINGRVGYQLPFSNSESSYFVNAGWYLWGMLVSDDSYGVSLLSGPQIFLSARFLQRTSKPLFVYFKFSPIFADQGFNFANREIAVGGGYRITNNLFGKLSLDITLDVSLFGVELVSPLRNISLSSFSVGASVPF